MVEQISLDQAAAADIAYIRRHWTVLAAEAWSGYVRRGRGVILIDRTPGSTAPVSYRSMIALREAHASDWLAIETIAQIRQYDPQCELICIVLRDDTTITTYRIRVAAPRPPDAYAQLCLLPQPQIA